MHRLFAQRSAGLAARLAPRTPGVVLLSVVLVGMVLSGCSSTGGGSVMMFADPGKYQYHTCPQLASAHKAVSTREQELRELIEKAERSAGGAVVGTIAYRSDYIAANEELRVIDQAVRAKSCPPPPPPWRSSTIIH
jgi:hypothetical protein